MNRRRLKVAIAGGLLFVLLACSGLLLLAYTRVPAALAAHVERRATRLYVDASSWEEVAEIDVRGYLRPRVLLDQQEIEGIWCLDVTVWGRRKGQALQDSLRWVGRRAANGEWVALPLGMISSVSLSQPHHPCTPRPLNSGARVEIGE